MPCRSTGSSRSPGRRRRVAASPRRCGRVPWVDGVTGSDGDGGSSCRSTRRGGRVGRAAPAGRRRGRAPGRVRARPTVARGCLPSAGRSGRRRSDRGMSAGVGPAPQGAARVVADAAPADRRRALPAGRPDLAAARAVPAGDHHRGGRRPAAGDPDPDPGRRRRGRPALEEPRPVRGARGDRPGDGLRGHGTGSRHGRVRPVEDASRAARSSAPRSRASGSCSRPASSWPSRSAGSTRRSCSSRCRSSAGSRLALLAWLSLAAWAAITFLASDRHRLRRGRGRRSGSWRCSCCRSPRPSRTSGRFLPGGLAGPAIALAAGAPVDAARCRWSPVIATRRPDRASRSVAQRWSFRRQEL